MTPQPHPVHAPAGKLAFVDEAAFRKNPKNVRNAPNEICTGQQLSSEPSWHARASPHLPELQFAEAPSGRFSLC